MSTGLQLESENRVLNQALRPALLRRLDGRRAVDGRPPFAAVCAADAVALSLLIVCLWRDRKVGSRPPASVWLLETSAVLLLSALWSPVAWTQHLVVVIPALYLIVSEHFCGRRLGLATSLAVGLYCLFAIALNYELLGRERYLVLLDYSIHTVAVLVLLGILLFRKPAADCAQRGAESTFRRSAAQISAGSRD